MFEASDEAGGIYAIKWLDPAKATKEKVKRFKNELQFCSGIGISTFSQL